MLKQFIETNLMSQTVWLALCYCAVIVAMGADLITGVTKSRRMGHKATSKGYKRTCEKAVKYFLPMICLSCIDLLATVIFAAPFLTMIFGAYCIFCELKSVLESTHRKEEIRQLEHIGLSALSADSLQQLSRLVADMLSKRKEDCDALD